MYIHKDDLTEKQKTHVILLEGMNIKIVICVDREANNYSFFAILNSGEMQDITWSVAMFAGVGMQKNETRRSIRTGNPETLVKDIAELVTGDWRNWKVNTIL